MDRARRERIAEGIAAKCVRRGLWTRAEAWEFLNGVYERTRGPDGQGRREALGGKEISGLDPGFWVTCSQCGAEGPEYDSNGRQHAINAWNRRDAS